jgi:hypothetical protein
VLKDLELNSQDLNEQLQLDSEFQGGNIVELPISIQKNGGSSHPKGDALSNGCSSPSLILGKHNKWISSPYNDCMITSQTSVYNGSSNCDKIRQNSTFSTKSEFVGNGCNELFIDDSILRPNEMSQNGGNSKYYTKSVEEIANKKLMGNGFRKRQNIISTYELCHECFDNTILMSNSDAGYQPSAFSGGHSKYCSKNKNMQNMSDFNSLGSNKNSSSNTVHSSFLGPSQTQNQNLNQMKIGSSYSNQDLNNTNMVAYSNNDQTPGGYSLRSRSVLSQIHESVVPDNHGSAKQTPATILRNNIKTNVNEMPKGSSAGFNSSNGHVISQKVISIGLPGASGSSATNQNQNNMNNARNEDRSPSPKFIDARSKFLLLLLFKL